MHFTADTAPETIEFNGTIYRRMGGRRRYYLSQSNSNAGRKRAKGLHVAVWEFYSGLTVPCGHEVHHKDGNTFNFLFDNLDCLTKSKHRRLPKQNTWEGLTDHLDRIRSLATNWHRSPEGREWHRKNAVTSLRKPGAAKPFSLVEAKAGTCMWCGGEMMFKQSRRIFCSMKCASQECGYRLGKYKFVHPNYDPSRRVKSA
jgi:hypothetical protein